MREHRASKGEREYYTSFEEIKKLGGKKLIKCIDCGNEFIANSKASKIKRCNDCQKKYNNYMRRQRYYKKLFDDNKLYEFNDIYYSSPVTMDGYTLINITDVNNPCRQFNRALIFEKDNKDGSMSDQMIIFGKITDFHL